MSTHERRSSRAPIQVWVRSLGKNDVREWLDDETLSGDFTFVYQTQDIGEGGLFVESDAPFSVGEELDLEIALPGNSSFTARARVKWVRDIEDAVRDGYKPGMGLEWIDLPQDVREAIRAFLIETQA